MTRGLTIGALLAAACGGGGHGGTDASGGDGGPDFSGDVLAPWAGGPGYYATWPAGPPHDPAFFPIAVWLQSPIPNAAAYKGIGVNTFIGLSGGGLDSGNLDAVEANGMLAMDSQDTGYASFVDRAGLVAWTQQDEPDNAQPISGGGYGPCISPQTIATRGGAMRANDATRPVYLNVGRAVADESWVGRGDCSGHDDDYPMYAAASDIVSFDVYPVNAGLPIEVIAHGVDRLRGWAADQRPVWTWIESTQYDQANGQPTPADIRTEVWMALVHGAMGFGYFCHVFTPGFIEAGLLADDNIKTAVGAIDTRVTALAPVLNTQSVSNGVAVQTTGDVPIDTMVKRASGVTYLFAVAMRGSATSATFTLRDFPATATAEVLDENRQIDVAGGVFTDAFDGYAVHLYRITY